MARRKEDPPKGSPAWMNTFADLMNLLLCFFVMLFSMSSVNEEKFEKVIASFQSTFSILPGGGASIGEGELISSGISQLENFDSYYNQQLSSQSDGQTEEEKTLPKHMNSRNWKSLRIWRSNLKMHFRNMGYRTTSRLILMQSM